jgi:HSP20 family protein
MGDKRRVMDSISSHRRLAPITPIWRPPTDVYETESAFFVRVEIAGMSEDDFNIELEARSLSIQGVRSDVSERRAFYQMEIPFGEFICSVELPAPVDASQVEAVYNQGFLRVTLPKARSPENPDL